MLAPSSDDGVVVVDDRLVGKCSSRRTSSRCSNPSRMVPTRWPVPSEWSAVTTGLRLGRVVRDARLPYLRNQTICNVNVQMTHTTSQYKCMCTCALTQAYVDTSLVADTQQV